MEEEGGEARGEEKRWCLDNWRENRDIIIPFIYYLRSIYTQLKIIKYV